MKQSQCRECGKKIEVPEEVASLFKSSHVNPICSECQSEENHTKANVVDAATKKLRKKQFEDQCPAAFHGSDITKLKEISSGKCDDVLSWKYDSKGLFITGPFRCGKTRAVWELLRRNWMSNETSFRSMTNFELVLDSNQMKGFGGDYGKWKSKVISPKILFLDDLGKSKLDEFATGALFELIDGRAARNKPTIITSNETRATLEEKVLRSAGEFSQRTIEAITERISEFFNVIEF